MKSVYDGDRGKALAHLQDVSIDSVPKDIEQFMFASQIVGDKDATRSEIVQISLQNVIDTMEEMNV